MLVLTRKPGEGINVGDTIHFKIVRVNGNRVTVGVEAPRDVRIVRDELPPLREEGEDKPPSAA